MSINRYQEFVITIDGPAGAGKSSVARLLAAHFEFDFLDTGAMYRTVTLACLQRQIDMFDGDEVVKIARDTRIEFQGNQVFSNGIDVTTAIRSSEVNENIRFVADNPRVRKILGNLQVRLAAGKQIVAEGRDQGTDVFPNAGCKIFLTATPETRARRRHMELLNQGSSTTYEEVLEAQKKRDLEDSQRPVGALRAAADAEIVYTDNLTQQEVVRRLAEIVNEKLHTIGAKSC